MPSDTATRIHATSRDDGRFVRVHSPGDVFSLPTTGHGHAEVVAANLNRAIEVARQEGRDEADAEMAKLIQALKTARFAISLTTPASDHEADLQSNAIKKISAALARCEEGKSQ